MNLSRAPRISIAILAVSIVLHLVGYLQFASRIAPFHLLSGFHSTFGYLVLVSAAIALGMFLVDNRVIFRLLLVLRILVLILLNVDFEGILIISFTLLTPLLLEVSTSEPFPYGVVLSAAPAIIVLAIQLRRLVGASPSAGLSISDAVALCVISLVFVWSNSLFVGYREKLIGEELRSEKLDEAVTRLTDANIQFQRYAHDVEERSALNERMRVSREIHDMIGCTLMNIIMMMEAASDLLPAGAEKAKEMVKKARDQAEVGLNETRRSLRTLRAVETPKISGVRAIQKLLEVFRDGANVSVSVEYGNVAWKYRDEVDQAIYHVVQEGLTNAFRHGRANEIRIFLWEDCGEIIVRVHDNGKGASEIKEGIGFSGIKERLRPLGGRMSARNVIDGFELIAYVPT